VPICPPPIADSRNQKDVRRQKWLRKTKAWDEVESDDTASAFCCVGGLPQSAGGLLTETSLDAFAVNLGRSLFAAITVAVFTPQKRVLRSTGCCHLLYAGTLTCLFMRIKRRPPVNMIFYNTPRRFVLILAPFILKNFARQI